MLLLLSVLLLSGAYGRGDGPFGEATVSLARKRFAWAGNGSLGQQTVHLGGKLFVRAGNGSFGQKTVRLARKRLTGQKTVRSVDETRYTENLQSGGEKNFNVTIEEKSVINAGKLRYLGEYFCQGWR